ncbi:hypothetical protein [Pseudoxanthomonas jiangsuensis]|uniref:hypothetical protein n=1 Tax=Pseudoxanthomonas jiangsuensis TaxID=619688 RepID=UPI001FE48F94|nr:hypothetical protein [Pseudoxanthomonas jiangsuensis]
MLHRFGPELIRVLLAVAHKHLGHCHQLWQPDVYERLAGPPGAEHVLEMQRLADAGDGLNSYINRYVRDDYARRLD